MKLYDLPEPSPLRIGGIDCTFHHLDGMYSYCTNDELGNVFHLSAPTPVELVDGRYQIVTEENEKTN
jgi:hypothetical protein